MSIGEDNTSSKIHVWDGYCSENMGYGYRKVTDGKGSRTENSGYTSAKYGVFLVPWETVQSLITGLDGGSVESA